MSNPPLSSLACRLLLFYFGLVPSTDAQPYLDPETPMEERVENLLSLMTLEEKIGQMTQTERGQFAGGNAANIATYRVGSVLSGGGSAPGPTVTDWTTMFNTFQTQALSTPLGIPLLYGVDAVHGHNNLHGAVIFPHNIGLGCTRDPALVEACARITALEVRASGPNWTFSPCVAVPRDERWGRTYEGFGEDPELVSLLGAAAIKGFQTDSLGAENGILACAKHFVADGGTHLGIDQGNALISETTLRDIHLPPYTAGLQQGVGTIMASFSQWNGAHCHSHEYLLTDVLKEEMGFAGFILSDWAGINQVNPADFSAAIADCINAGIDMAMQPHDYIDFQERLRNLVLNGEVPLARIDDAVRRILRIKFRMGLFEHPFAPEGLADTVGCPTHRAVAREAVRKSLVLLKNDGLLPLSKSTPQVLVAGSRANDLGAQCGGWTISWQGGSGDITEGTTILEAVTETLDGGTVHFAAAPPIPSSDLAIVVVGEDAYAEGAGDIAAGSDRFYLSQEDEVLLAAIEEADIPTVVVMLSGRPLLPREWFGKVEAVVAAWLPGTEGAGVTDVLFGDHAPTGQLGHSWPSNEFNQPVNVGEAGPAPLFPYGYGLTYAPTTGSEPAQPDAFLTMNPYPNPSAGGFRLDNPRRERLAVSLFDARGRCVYEAPAASDLVISVPAEHLLPGLYILRASGARAARSWRVVRQ